MTDQMLRDTVALDMAHRDCDLLDMVKYAEAMAPVMAREHQRLAKVWYWGVQVSPFRPMLTVFVEHTN